MGAAAKEVAVEAKVGVMGTVDAVAVLAAAVTAVAVVAVAATEATVARVGKRVVVHSLRSRSHSGRANNLQSLGLHRCILHST